MNFQIQCAPVFSVIEFQLNSGEQVIAQPDSMVSMTSGMRIRASASTGTGVVGRSWRAGFRSLLGGESFFRAIFEARRDDQVLLLAPESYGEILSIALSESDSMYLTRGSYLAHTGDCSLDIRYGGMKGVMSKTGLFLLQITGPGQLFCQTYGAIRERVLVEGEKFLVDNRYVVAFSSSLQYELVRSSERLTDSFFSGEGFINRFTGPGRLLYQTRVKPAGGMLRLLFSAVT